MDLDEQLAALAAGELDDDTARALRARASTDPALAGRLARHRQLQRLLEGWEPPAMSEEAAARLVARVDAALAALEDGPLADDDVVPLTPATPRPLADASEQDAPAGGVPADGDGRVVDLGEARRRRGLPSWLPGAAVAAALVVVVGTGVVLGGLPSASDMDTFAGGADEATDGPVEEQAADSADSGEMFNDSTTALEDDGGGPMRASDIVVAEGELLELVALEQTEAAQADGSAATTGGADDDTAADDTADDGGADDQGAGEPPAATAVAPADAQCVTEALDRDTEQVDGREVWLVGNGTYADEPAVFVVIRTPAAPEDRFDVLAYDPAECALLARDATG